MKKIKINDEKIFEVILLIIAAIFIVKSFSFNSKAMVFPLLFGGIVFCMILLQMIVRSMKTTPKSLRFVVKGGLIKNFGRNAQEVQEKGEGETEIEDENTFSWKTVSVILLWLIAYVIVMSLINYILATFLFLIFFLRFMAKIRWVTTIVFSIIFSGALYALFGLILTNG